MRVLIDTTYARRAPRSGTAVYTNMLCQELAATGEVDLLPVSNPRRRPAGGGTVQSLRNLLADEWWLTAELPRLAARAGAQLIHHPLPAIARRARVPQVVTVHDLSFERLPECFERRFRLYAHRTHRAAALRAAAVICVSRSTADDAHELWRTPPERTVVARHGPGQPLPAVVRPDAPRHFLYVGDQEPRKNLATLLDAYRRYRAAEERPLPLVLAGGVGRDDRAGGAGAEVPGVVVESEPSAERLAELYAGAAALIQPSLYEGFGLTVLEAMGAGTPVLAARSPGLLEIGDDAVAWTEPRDSGSMADCMHDLSSSEALRRELTERGRQRAARFSWAQCARDHLTAYSLALRAR